MTITFLRTLVLAVMLMPIAALPISVNCTQGHRKCVPSTERFPQQTSHRYRTSTPTSIYPLRLHQPPHAPQFFPVLYPYELSGAPVIGQPGIISPPTRTYVYFRHRAAQVESLEIDPLCPTF